jgi:large subunit ribosomal protein L6
MSRIGKMPITLPQGVSYSFDKKAGTFNIKGPKGELTQSLDPSFEIEESEGSLLVKRPTEQKRHKAMHGLYRSLINNMTIGVSEGYKLQLELIGVGFKAAAEQNVLELNLGYSHAIHMALPTEVSVNAETLKGKNPTITLESYDKQLIGQVAAKIKSLRPVEPYKGKGVRFVGEFVRKKAGKQAAK